MVEQYCQTLDVEVESKSKQKQWIGITLVLFSLGFLMLSIFYSWWFLFAFALTFTVGCLFIYLYNKTAKEYTYEFNPTRLTIASKDVVNRQKRVLTLLVKDICEFSIMSDMVDDDQDIVCCGKTYNMGVWQISFWLDGKMRRLLFVPDEYMIALIKEAIAGNNKVEC